MRLRTPSSTCPSGAGMRKCSTIGVRGGAGVMNRALTQLCPMPPGLVAARIYTRVPGPAGRLRENI